jgi:hypothetical protein
VAQVFLYLNFHGYQDSFNEATSTTSYVVGWPKIFWGYDVSGGEYRSRDPETITWTVLIIDFLTALVSLAIVALSCELWIRILQFLKAPPTSES